MKTAAPPRPASKGANARVAVCLVIVVATAATLPAGSAHALSRATVERQAEVKASMRLPGGSSTEGLHVRASAGAPTHEASAATTAIVLPWLRLTPPMLVEDDVLRAENSRLGLGRNSGASRLGRGPPKCGTALGKNARISTNCVGSYDSARYFDPKTSVWQSADPILSQYMHGVSNGGVFRPANLGLYTYSWNNPIVFRDPDGRAPGDIEARLIRGEITVEQATALMHQRGVLPANSGVLIKDTSGAIRLVGNTVMAAAAPVPKAAIVGLAFLAAYGENTANAVRDGEEAIPSRTTTDLVEDVAPFVLLPVAGAVIGKIVGQRMPAPKKLEAFPDVVPVRPKTPVQGGGGLRKRWVDRGGGIYEWDSQHGTVERYTKAGRHMGEFDPTTGQQLKPANPTRRVER